MHFNELLPGEAWSVAVSMLDDEFIELLLLGKPIECVVSDISLAANTGI